MSLCSKLTRAQSNAIYAEVMALNDVKNMRRLCKEDLFFLLTLACKRQDINRDWLYERCREVEADPNGHLDLWAREHYKSTIITYGMSIKDILCDPCVTIGIFSHTRPIAKAFLKQIKTELESNSFLQDLFPDILYKNPQKEATNWSLDGGITVKRPTNPKEGTVEAWGLVDGQPTSKHYSRQVFDDVVTRESVTSPEMLNKTAEAWGLSLSLGAAGGERRYIGTRYHFNDAYRTIMERGAAHPRIHAATDDGTPNGKPVFMDAKTLGERRMGGPYVFACHGVGTMVTMGDFSQKPIEEVRVGDQVIGWEFGKDGSRARLVRTPVLYAHSEIDELVESTLDNGDVLAHTPDHKWWTGRAPRAGRQTYSALGFEHGKQAYSALGFEHGKQAGVCKAFDLAALAKPLTPEQARAGAYLAGFFDADGSILGERGAITFSQDETVNGHICRRLEGHLDASGLPWAVTKSTRDTGSIACTYYLTGGREVLLRFYQMVRGLSEKAEAIPNLIIARGSRHFGKGCRVKLAGQKSLGPQQVYNIQTGTGNYIAGGYCSKNCQYLQNPVADNAQGFKRDWLRFYDSGIGEFGGPPKMMNVYITVDPASKKKKDNDYTVVAVVGLGVDRNYYLLDGVRDRLNLTERTNLLWRMRDKWRPLRTGYEQYGMQSDIEHIKYVQDERQDRFEIVEMGGQMPKEDRIRMLVPVFECGRYWLPRRLLFVDREGKAQDFVQDFLNDEYEAFPVSTHDDMFDCMARVLAPELGATFPMATATARPAAAPRKANSTYKVL